MNEKRLRTAIEMVSKNMEVSLFPHAFRLVVWELMKTQTALKKLEAKIKKMKK